MDKEHTLAPAKQQDNSIPAGLTLSPPCDALLYDPATEIGIDQPTLRTLHGIAQTRIV